MGDEVKKGGYVQTTESQRCHALEHGFEFTSDWTGCRWRMEILCSGLDVQAQPACLQYCVPSVLTQIFLNSNFKHKFSSWYAGMH